MLAALVLVFLGVAHFQKELETLSTVGYSCCHCFFFQSSVLTLLPRPRFLQCVLTAWIPDLKLVTASKGHDCRNTAGDQHVLWHMLVFNCLLLLVVRPSGRFISVSFLPCPSPPPIIYYSQWGLISVLLLFSLLETGSCSVALACLELDIQNQLLPNQRCSFLSLMSAAGIKVICHFTRMSIYFNLLLKWDQFFL